MPMTPAHEYLRVKLAATTAILEYVAAPEGEAGKSALATATACERRAATLRTSARDAIPVLTLAPRLGLSVQEEHVLWLLLAHEPVPDARAKGRTIAGGVGLD